MLTWDKRLHLHLVEVEVDDLVGVVALEPKVALLLVLPPPVGRELLVSVLDKRGSKVLQRKEGVRVGATGGRG